MKILFAKKKPQKRIILTFFLILQMVLMPVSAGISSWTGPPTMDATTGNEDTVDGWQVASNATILDGSIDVSGGIVEDGNEKITDFGFVLSSGISLDRKKSNVLWIKGGGEPEGFILKLTQSPYQPLLYIRAWAKNIAGYGIGPVRKVRIPEAPKSWWGEVQEGPGGWKTSDWFGNFINYERGWLYHARLGWLYSSSAEEESVWLWREENGWLWTKQDVWPYLWSHQSGYWLYLYPGKFGGSPKFYDYSIQSYR